MQETVTINKSNVIQAYFKGDESQKELLTNLFGAEMMSQKITDLIKTFEDVCKMQNVNPIDMLPFRNPFITSDQSACNMLVQLRMINRALCQDWEADYEDDNQKKWRPWFKYDTSSSCFRFSGSYYGSSHAFAGSGVRLVFPTKELSDYFGTQFEKLNSDYLTTK